MYNTFTLEPLHEEDIVVYLTDERTGLPPVHKCKFIGCITGFIGKKVEIQRLSKADIFVTPEETKDFGIDVIYPNDVVHILNSRYQLDNWLPFPQIINNITFHDKKELIEWIERQQQRDCHHCKNGTHKIVVTQPNGTFIRYENFCSECGRDLRNL